MTKIGFEIIGTGHYVPGEPVTNDDLARVITTSDEWIYQRSGIRQRHYAPDGVGVSDLACEAAKRAIASARIAPSEIDYILFATMTPDYIFPGSGALLGAKLGIPGVPALDIRQQCAAMLFGLQTIDGLIQTGAAKTILFVGAEAHAGFMPWEDWGALDPKNGRSATPEARAHADRHRNLAVLFGDGSGALVLRATDRDAGLRGNKICSDGRFAELLFVPGGGFRSRPYWKPTSFDEDLHIPRMDGRELFKFAVTKLPATARELCASQGLAIEQIDVFLAHQANGRINEHIRKDLGVPVEKLPSNIDRFGNTSGATVPILIDEEMRAGRVKKGQLAMVLALGTGVHWGCALWKL
ncbi:3-oxoacyl-[acyl-carrier-protein] synthase III C-terminal domain-containing protein [Sorangium sp. So ce281]|uniref:3-oxoacyl-[acyl-carrier-protein] synthase n=1 Tax=Sorangium cellulosum (strain So ce56) TaxID=448385 RepID=A9FLI4_SORC5|nr:3-oxoacyl-[acyl-carrier-protein] synthase III C-terminal domain-containing protein [Sorangium cellulosum]CAN95216.1 3-oxoacyl-[acyl-carrier-protein] synthase [Sorangium cellulosum So ce56]